MKTRLFVCALSLAACASEGRSNMPYVDSVVSFTAGANATFGADMLPDIIMGPPRGEGTARGSTDVLSLGKGGELIIELGRDVVDGPGIDLIVFENPFYIAGNPEAIFAEPGIVGVSADGESFTDWPCAKETAPYEGCAGVHPVFADGTITGNPETDGGDAFDLADIGVASARYVRIRDSGLGTGQRDQAPNAGFDLDAIYVIHPPSAE